MTLTFELDLDSLPLDLHAKNSSLYVWSFSCKSKTEGQTARNTDDAKTITPVADAGCKITHICFETTPRRIPKFLLWQVHRHDS